MDTRDDGSGKESSSGHWAKEETSEKWGNNDESSWKNHHLEGSLSGDADATVVVWCVCSQTILSLVGDEIGSVEAVSEVNFSGRGENTFLTFDVWNILLLHLLVTVLGWVVLAGPVVCVNLFHFVEVINDEGHHLKCSISDSLHSQGREGIWEHGTDKKSSELDWLEDVD